MCFCDMLLHNSEAEMADVLRLFSLFVHFCVVGFFWRNDVIGDNTGTDTAS
jgi:hypothetical protein